MTTPSSIPIDVYIAGSTGQTKIHDFNPGRKSWQIYAHKISTIGDNLIFEAIGTNSEIYFKQKNNEVYKITDLLGGANSYDDGQAINIGYNAGLTDPSNHSIAIGNQAGETNQSAHSVAIGDRAGMTTQGEESTALGFMCGYTSQGNHAVAIGSRSGYLNQSIIGIAIGLQAAYRRQSYGGISIGRWSGYEDQGEHSIAIGSFAGQSAQGDESICIGYNAGLNNIGTQSIAIGFNTSAVTPDTVQGNNIAIGTYAGYQNQAVDVNYPQYAGKSIAIGYYAANIDQAQRSIAIGSHAAETNQGGWAIAIGEEAGQTNQKSNACGIGWRAGYNEQGMYAVAVGDGAGVQSQGNFSVAIGQAAGRDNQGIESVAIGRSSCQSGQGNYAVAIGRNSGAGTNSVGIGAYSDAGNERSIVLNATGSALNSGSSDALFIKPIRSDTNSNKLLYNSSTGEITYQPDSGGGGGIDTTIGKAITGTWATSHNSAFWAFHTMNDATNYALRQDQAGETYINSGYHRVHFLIEGVNQMRLTTTGLGIGNTAPTEKLDVTGNIKASGSITANSISVTGLDTDTGTVVTPEVASTTSTIDVGSGVNRRIRIEDKSTTNFGELEINPIRTAAGISSNVEPINSYIQFFAQGGASDMTLFSEDMIQIRTNSNSYIRVTPTEATCTSPFTAPKLVSPRVETSGELQFAPNGGTNYMAVSYGSESLKFTPSWGGNNSMYFYNGAVQTTTIQGKDFCHLIGDNAGITLQSGLITANQPFYNPNTIITSGDAIWGTTPIAYTSNLNGLTLRHSSLTSNTAYWNLACSFDASTQTGNLHVTYGGVYKGYFAQNAYVSNIDFTGQHRSQFEGGYTPELVGLIVESTGSYLELNGSVAPTIDEALPSVRLTSAAKSKRVYGVISGIEGENREYGTGFVTVVPKEDGVTRIIVNSVGEGSLWVINTNGNLENGDYVCSSSITGYGERQEDDLLHSYTVAKVTMDLDWSNLPDWVQTRHVNVDGTIAEDGTYLCAFVGCTYHCG